MKLNRKITTAIIFLAIISSAYALQNTVFSDIDNDGDLDMYLETTIETVNANTFYYRNATDNIGNVANVKQGYFVDVNGDNREDLYIVRRNAPNYLFLWQSAFKFTNATNTSLGRNITGSAGSPYGTAFDDLNGDGNPDALVDGQLFMNITSTTSFLNATNLSNIDEMPRLRHIEINDINIDGNKDIIGVKENGQVIIWLSLGDYNNDGVPEFYDATEDTGFSALTGTNLAEAENIRIGLAINRTLAYYPFTGITAPFVSDNFTDIYLARITDNQLLVQLFPETRKDYSAANTPMFYIPTFIEKSEGVNDTANSTGAILADFDSNSFIDLYVANGNPTSQLYLRNQSSWSTVFENMSKNFSNISISKLAQAADLTGDGTLDVAYIDDQGIYIGQNLVPGTNTPDVWPTIAGGTGDSYAQNNQILVDSMTNAEDLVRVFPPPAPEAPSSTSITQGGHILLGAGDIDFRDEEPEEPPGPPPPPPTVRRGGGGGGSASQELVKTATVHGCDGTTRVMQAPYPSIETDFAKEGFYQLEIGSAPYVDLVETGMNNGKLADPSIPVPYRIAQGPDGTYFLEKAILKNGAECTVYEADNPFSKCCGGTTWQCLEPGPEYEEPVFMIEEEEEPEFKDEPEECVCPQEEQPSCHNPANMAAPESDPACIDCRGLTATVLEDLVTPYNDPDEVPAIDYTDAEVETPCLPQNKDGECEEEEADVGTPKKKPITCPRGTIQIDAFTCINKPVDRGLLLIEEVYVWSDFVEPAEEPEETADVVAGQSALTAVSDEAVQAVSADIAASPDVNMITGAQALEAAIEVEMGDEIVGEAVIVERPADVAEVEAYIADTLAAGSPDLAIADPDITYDAFVPSEQEISVEYIISDEYPVTLDEIKAAGLMDKDDPVAIEVANLGPIEDIIIEGTPFEVIYYKQDTYEKWKQINKQSENASGYVKKMFDVVGKLLALQDVEEFDNVYTARDEIAGLAMQASPMFYFTPSFYEDLELIVSNSRYMFEFKDIQDRIMYLSELIYDASPISKDQTSMFKGYADELSAELDSLRAELPELQQYEYALDTGTLETDTQIVQNNLDVPEDVDVGNDVFAAETEYQDVLQRATKRVQAAANDARLQITPWAAETDTGKLADVVEAKKMKAEAEAIRAATETAVSVIEDVDEEPIMLMPAPAQQMVSQAIEQGTAQEVNGLVCVPESQAQQYVQADITDTTTDVVVQNADAAMVLEADVQAVEAAQPSASPITGMAVSDFEGAIETDSKPKEEIIKSEKTIALATRTGAAEELEKTGQSSLSFMPKKLAGQSYRCVVTTEIPEEALEKLRKKEIGEVKEPLPVPAQEPMLEIEYEATKVTLKFETTQDVRIPYGESHMFVIGRDLKIVSREAKPLTEEDFEELEQIEQKEPEVCKIVNGEVVCSEHENCEIIDGKMVCESTFSMACPVPAVPSIRGGGVECPVPTEFEKAGCRFDKEGVPSCPGYDACKMEGNELVCTKDMQPGCTFGDKVECEGFRENECQIAEDGTLDCKKTTDLCNAAEGRNPNCPGFTECEYDEAGNAVCKSDELECTFGDEVVCEGKSKCEIVDGKVKCSNLQEGCAETPLGIICEGYQAGYCQLDEQGRAYCDETGKLPEGCSVTTAGELVCPDYELPENCQVAEGKITCGSLSYCTMGEDGKITCEPTPKYETKPKDCVYKAGGEGKGGEMLCTPGLDQLSGFPEECYYDIVRGVVCTEPVELQEGCYWTSTGVECTGKPSGTCGWKDGKFECVKTKSTQVPQNCWMQGGEFVCEGYAPGQCGFLPGSTKLECSTGEKRDTPEGCILGETTIQCGSIELELPPECQVQNFKVRCEGYEGDCYFIGGQLRCN